MHTPSILMGSVAVLSAIVSAEPDRPKFYFPRQINRSKGLANLTATPLPPTRQSPFTPSTKRSTTDLFNGGTTGTDGGQTSSAGTTGNLLDSVIAGILPSSDSTDVSAAAASSSEVVVVVTIQSTETVQPSSAPTSTILDSSPSDVNILGSTGLLPSIIVLPTTSDASTSAPAENAGDSTTGGILTSPSAATTSATDSSTENILTSGISFTGTGGSTAAATDSSSAPTSTDPGLIPILSSVISQVTSALDPQTSTDASTDPAVTTTSDPTPESTAAGTSDLLSSIIASITDLDPTVTSGLTGPATTGDATITTNPPAAATSTSPPDSTGLGSILSSILDPPTSTDSATSDISIPTSTDSGIITATDPPVSSSTLLPTSPPGNSTDVVSPPTSTVVGTGSGGVVSPTLSPTVSTTGLPPTSTASGVLPPTDTAISTNGTVATDSAALTPTSLPAANGTDTTATAPNSLPTATLPTTATTPVNATDIGVTSAAPTITTAPSASGIITVGPTAAPTETSPPSVIIPTGTDPGTSMWLPSSIIIAASGTPTDGASPTQQPTGISSTLPKIIIAPNATLDTTPEGMTLAQLGFLFPLNWDFVAANSLSAAQIFSYLPVGISSGLNLPGDQVIMHSLLPLDTSEQLNYVTTLAMVYIPDNMMNTLALDLHSPMAAIYQNNLDPSVAELMGYLNPVIPLQPGASLGSGDATGTGVSSSPTSNANGNAGVFNTEAQNTSPKVTSTTAGIAMGCVGAAAAYGAAMFFIARRYKRKKQTHRRSSSILSNSEMRQSGSPALLSGGNALMAGGRSSYGGTTPSHDRNSRGSGRSAGNSARTQQISAPMMAENSLGWN